MGAQPDPLTSPHADGTQVLDVRPVEPFAAGHHAGALSVPARGRASDEGGVRPRRGRVVVVASDADEAAAAIRGLRSVGILDVAGRARGRPGDAELVSVGQLDELLERGAELIDVREKDERDTGYIAGSRNIPYRLLALGAAELPRDRPIVTICETGPRAAIAASILSARGFDAHPVVNGGIDSWAAAGKPTVEFRRCGG